MIPYRESGSPVGEGNRAATPGSQVRRSVARFGAQGALRPSWRSERRLFNHRWST